MYCGNNLSHPSLLNNEKKLGSRYGCMKKGIGVGLHLPIDPDYKVPYTPYERVKIYCGDQKELPPGYTRFGSPSSCLRKGVGIGKNIRARGGSRGRGRGRGRRR